MAIKKIHTKFNVDFSNAYHRIEWMNMNILDGNNSVSVVVNTYPSKELATTENLIFQKSYNLQIEKAYVSMTKCYEKLMEHEDFANSVAD